MTSFSCIVCHKPFPKEFAFRCPDCGGVFSIESNIFFDPLRIETELPGIWPYRHTFGLTENAPIITLGEGNTPLVFAKVLEKEIALKLEYQNPTGSFKDRLTATEMSFLVSLGATIAVEDSSGNAGASFAAYASRAGIHGKVFVPDSASGPKRVQIEMYGAEVVLIKGSRSRTAEAVIKEVETTGKIYASHAYLPHGLPGLATIAYEIYEQLGQTPGTIIAPVGHGSLLLGIFLGFSGLKDANIIKSIPVHVGVQAKNCSPLWSKTQETDSENRGQENGTVAEGVRVENPARGSELLELSESQPIRFIAVEESEILPGRDCLASLGFYVEPTSAVVWNALSQVTDEVPDPIVVVLTGSGLKYNKYDIKFIKLLEEKWKRSS